MVVWRAMLSEGKLVSASTSVSPWPMARSVCSTSAFRRLSIPLSMVGSFRSAEMVLDGLGEGPGEDALFGRVVMDAVDGRNA